MDKDTQIGEEDFSSRTTAHTWKWPLEQNWRLLRRWRWRWPRVTVAGVAAITVAAAVISMNGMMTASQTPWWNIAAVTIGSLLAGLVVGSYVGAPIGAQATVCDTRWPILGIAGLVLATPSAPANVSTHLLSGASPTVLAGAVQAVIAIVSLALLMWAVGERFELERKAVSPSTSMESGESCASCSPLFPSKLGAPRGPGR